MTRARTTVRAITTPMTSHTLGLSNQRMRRSLINGLLRWTAFHAQPELLRYDLARERIEDVEIADLLFLKRDSQLRQPGADTPVERRVKRRDIRNPRAGRHSLRIRRIAVVARSVAEVVMIRQARLINQFFVA